ncbi:Pilus assembly protein [Burkholderiales bacterium 8X]|nr:Pilus assembly protein [Burkholderiales bacterium 8X]
MNHPSSCTARQEKRAAAAAGFTLIEVMIVVAVIAILAAIAYPSYQEYIRKARRSDAKSALLDLAARQERFFSINNVYSSSAPALGYGSAAAFPVDVVAGSTAFYQLSVAVVAPSPAASPPTPAGFTATAAPIGAQVDDKCGSFVVDQLGTHTLASNTAPASACW